MVQRISIRVADKKNQKSTSTINIPSATLQADAAEFASTLAQLYANMTIGVVESVSITNEIDVSGLAGNTMGDGADVEEGLKTSFRTSTGFVTGTRIPAINETKLFPAGASQIVTGDDVDFDQFVSYMTGGFTATSTNIVSPVDRRADDIVSLIAGLEDFQKTRR